MLVKEIKPIRNAVHIVLYVADKDYKTIYINESKFRPICWDTFVSDYGNKVIHKYEVLSGTTYKWYVVDSENARETDKIKVLRQLL